MPAAVVTPSITAASIVASITRKIDAVLPDRKVLSLRQDMLAMVDRIAELNTALATAATQAAAMAPSDDVTKGASLDAFVRTDRDRLLAQMVEVEKILRYQDSVGNLKATGKKVLADVQALLEIKR